MRAAILILLFLLSATAFSITNTQILAQAQPYLPTIDSILSEYWPDGSCNHFIAAQIEQETCASIRQCWNANTELKTSREYGFGLSEITIAFNADGSTRFDNFVAAKQKYKELKDWTWTGRFNVRYQLLYIVLQCKSLYAKFGLLFDSDIDTYACAFVGYNAGSGTVASRRALCKLTQGCDCDSWFGGLATVHLKTEDALLYGSSLYQRRNSYPYNIIYLRASKYEPYFPN